MVNLNKKIAVLGSGDMGTGIAQTFASKGCEVKIVFATKKSNRKNPLDTIKENLEVLCQNDVMTEKEIPGILEKISFTDQLEEAAKFADIIFESIVENLDIKQDYFSLLDRLCPPSTILATNTSAISVTEIAEKSIYKERIIGTHFWKPAYLIPLVEVIKTKYVSDDVVKETYGLLESIGKTPVIVEKDVPGFLANRLQHALFREAISIVENGIATPEDVDRAIKNGFGLRLGVMAPMEVMDSGGIDLTYSIHKYLFPSIESSTEPSPLLIEKLNSGKLGFKSGEGFLKWSKEDIIASKKNLIEGLIKVERALGKM